MIREDIIARQSLTLEKKIKVSLSRIEEFYNKMNGNVYISFSGGLDSTVLLDLIRKKYPDILAVRIKEPSYIELNDFVRSTDNVRELIPKASYYDIIKKYGYPVISKEVAKNISRYRNSDNHDVKVYRKWGIRKDGTKGKIGVIPRKWHYLIDAPFKISDKCCDIIKKNPIKIFEREQRLKPYLGIKASDSNKRFLEYIKNGCNSFKVNREKSMPLGFWTDIDIKRYVRRYNVDYCNLYDKGEKRLGCIFCLFGIHLERFPNRIQRMYNINERLYDYGLNTLNLKDVLKCIKVDYRAYRRLDQFG